jgi:hypothetical protein
MGTSWIASVSMCLDDKRRTKEKEEILEGLSHLVDVPGPDNGLLFHGMGLLIKVPGLLLNGQMILLGSRHHLQNHQKAKRSICLHITTKLHITLSSGLLSRLFTPHNATSHLLAPLPLIVPSPLITSLLGLSSGLFSRCLSSRRRLPSDKDNNIDNDVTSYAFAPAGDSCCRRCKYIAIK